MARTASGASGKSGRRSPRPSYRFRRRRYALAGTAVALAALAGLSLVLMPAPIGAVPTVGGIDGDLHVRPQYAFSFPAPGARPLERPIGLVTDDDGVFVVDSAAGEVRVFDGRGDDRSVIGSGTLEVPVYVARDAARGILYVTDRKLASVFKFDDVDGSLLGRLEPRAAGESTASAESTSWAPLGIDVAEDGTVWVSDVLNRHRVLALEPDGTIIREIGGARAAVETTGVAVVLDYPNGVSVGAEEVWVSDSNNRRVVVFGRDGAFRRVLTIDGLARGIDFVPVGATGGSADSTLVVVADALAQDIAVWDASGAVLGRFGGPGSGAGQLAFPNDVDSDRSGKRLYVADTGNRRVQAWVWAEVGADAQGIGALVASLDASGRIPFVLASLVLALAAVGLVVVALAPLTFVVTGDFLSAMTERGWLGRMAGRGRRFVTTAAIAEEARMPAFVTVEDAGEASPEAAFNALVRRYRLVLAEDRSRVAEMRSQGADVLDTSDFEAVFVRRR